MEYVSSIYKCYVAYTLAGRHTISIFMVPAFTVCGAAFIVIVPLVAASWLPPGFPVLLRQVLLTLWGAGAVVVADRWLFRRTFSESLRAVGFRCPSARALVAAGLASVPMWAFLPLAGWMNGANVELRPDWLVLLVGVVLVRRNRAPRRQPDI